jgi:hypothetical protein
METVTKASFLMDSGMESAYIETLLDRSSMMVNGLRISMLPFFDYIIGKVIHNIISSF